MASNKHDLIKQVTANRRSRFGFYEIVEAKLAGNTLWLLLRKPDGSPVVAWEQFSEHNGVWSATVYSADLPSFVATPGQLYADAVKQRPQVLAWQGYVERVQNRREKLRAFRRALAPDDTLSLNGYAYTLVRRLLEGNGWVVKRRETELRLEGPNFEKAVNLACPA